MLRVSVEKYRDGRQESGFWVPVPVVKWAAGVLPEAAKRGLLKSGIYLDEMVNATEAETPFARWIEVEEKGVRKSIKFTVTS
ncbi:hypothetical protein [Devosia lucknowensis]|uniref:hypothetical protein n=1 Tax=Devosia lucknowensis TaxID=1096929 RepID=UPI000A3C6E4C|nr:hypothetical protein [Devosia lucknowensis]